MTRIRLMIISLTAALLFAPLAVPLHADEGKPKPVKIKLPKSLYCAMTAVRDRYSINLVPLAKALGDPAEAWEAQLFRNGHLVAPLGKIGGGLKLEEFILFTLPPADADAFDSATASRAEIAGGSDEQFGEGIGPGRDGRESALRGKVGRSFELRILSAGGELLVKKKVVLFLN